MNVAVAIAAVVVAVVVVAVVVVAIVVVAVVVVAVAVFAVVVIIAARRQGSRWNNALTGSEEMLGRRSDCPCCCRYRRTSRE